MTLDASLKFYRDVLVPRFSPSRTTAGCSARRDAVLLAGRTALCLQCHLATPVKDSIPFAHRPASRGSGGGVEGRPALLAEHLTGAGVEHSGVKPLPGYGDVIELRDPDGILVASHAMPD